ncbi:MAG: hypothetical protein FWE23_07580 [Chitinivibrionia bacterium]|nr:hypothetical protein [Chitinivibrionia bacterium]
MRFSKKVLFFRAWIWVLVLLKPLLAQNFELSSESGILLHLQDDRIFFWNADINYDNPKFFRNRLGFLKIGSNMPWFTSEIIRADYSVKFDFNAISPQIFAGFFSQSEIETRFRHRGDQIKITNEGAKGFYIGSNVELNIRDFRFTPSFLLGKGKFDDGCFYYFFGKPDIPLFLHFGLSAEHKERHKLNISYQTFDINIVNNAEMPLFNSDNYVLGINYRHLFSKPQKLSNIYGILGLNYASFSADGSINPANQQYFLFPYMFFDIDGEANALALWTALSFELQARRLNHLFMLGAANIIGGEFSADVHYLYKRLFGGREKQREMYLDLKNTGLAFLGYSLESPPLNIKNRAKIHFGMRKIFAAPWGLDKFRANDVEESPIINETSNRKNVWKTILLSGLSGYFRVEF